MKAKEIPEIEEQEQDKINILLTHTQLDASNEEEAYNPIAKKELKQLGFDYIALGHVHKPSYQEEENQNIIYPRFTNCYGI